MHLDPGEGRDVIGLGNLKQARGFELGEHLGRPLGGGAPWIRIPARSRHHVSTRAWESARSVNLSPDQKLPRTSWTARSTRGLDHVVNYTQSGRSV